MVPSNSRLRTMTTARTNGTERSAAVVKDLLVTANRCAEQGLTWMSTWLVSRVLASCERCRVLMTHASSSYSRPRSPIRARGSHALYGTLATKLLEKI